MSGNYTYSVSLNVYKMSFLQNSKIPKLIERIGEEYNFLKFKSIIVGQ